LDNAIAQEMSAQAAVLAAQAQVEDAEINLSYTTISSPVSGQAGQAKFRVGALISPTQDLLTTVSVLDPIWVNFSVSEQDMLQSQQDRSKGRLVFPPDDHFEIELILADQSLFPERGSVNFASPTYSQKTGTMVIRATLPNPDTILRPGQFVRVKVLGATRPNAIVIPQRAVAQSQNGSYVFVVDDENKAQTRPVELGPWDGGNWVIYEGLQGGDRVVVDGINKILPGSVVKIKQEISQADATRTTGEISQ
jgi:membrane fusion protein (multidrug efflux system)